MLTGLDDTHRWFCEHVVFRDGALSVTLVEGLLGVPGPLEVGGIELGPAAPVAPGSASRRAEVRFATVFSYRVVDESYVNDLAQSERATGDGDGVIRVFARSPFLALLTGDGVFEAHGHIAAARHYRICALDWTVDVAAATAPTCTLHAAD